MLSFIVFLEPLSRLIAEWALPMHPEVGMRVDDYAFWDVADFSHRYFKEGEVSEFEMLLEEIIGCTAGEDGSAFEAGQAGEGGFAVAFRVVPLDMPIEMIVSKKAFPERGDFVIGQTNVAAGDGTT